MLINASILGVELLSPTVPPPTVLFAVTLICPGHIFVDAVERVWQRYYSNRHAISDHALARPAPVLMNGNMNLSNMAQSETTLCRGCVMYLSNV